MNMGLRAAPALEAFRSWAGRAPGPIQEASLPAGCPACPGLPRPAAAGPPLASSPWPVGSGAVRPAPCVDRLQGHLREAGQPAASAGSPPALPPGVWAPSGQPLSGCSRATACGAPALPVLAGWPQAPRAVWVLPARREQTGAFRPERQVETSLSRDFTPGEGFVATSSASTREAAASLWWVIRWQLHLGVLCWRHWGTRGASRTQTPPWGPASRACPPPGPRSAWGPAKPTCSSDPPTEAWHLPAPNAGVQPWFECLLIESV